MIVSRGSGRYAPRSKRTQVTHAFANVLGDVPASLKGQGRVRDEDGHTGGEHIGANGEMKFQWAKASG